MTPNENIVTDEDVKTDDARFKELNIKEDRNDDENKELGEIKERYHGRAEKRIGTLTYEKKSAQERAERAEQEREELKARLADIDKKDDEIIPKVSNATVEHDGLKFFTDDALASKVQAGELTEREAVKHQQERIEASASDRAYNRIKKEDKDNSFNDTRQEDIKKVLKDYPEFSNKHADHNPNDPLFKLANELYSDGLGVKPDGLSRSITRAKQILGSGIKKPDISEDLSLDRGLPASRGKNKEDTIVLDDDEKELAVRTYTLGDAPMNTKTGKPYTVKEAHEKALQAKKTRLK